MRSNKPENLEFEQVSSPPKGFRSRLKHIEKATTMHAHNFIVRRWSNLKEVRRSALIWMAIAAALIGAGWLQTTASQALYSHEDAAEGNTYIEGSVGEVETLNPIFATNVAERGLSKLLFAGLLRTNERGDVVGDLAESWVIKNSGKTYSLTLKPGVKWSDGKPLTTKDILFTIDAIQSPITRSPLLAAWSNIKVEAKNERTVDFTLQVPYAPFVSTLMVGILPEHIFANVQPQQLKNAAFNTQPSVTSGPFNFRGIVEGREGIRLQSDVYLTKNNNYHLGPPKLDRFAMRVYPDSDELVSAMRDREIMAASDVPAHDIEQFTNQAGLKTTKLRPFSGVYAFYKTNTPPLDDENVRKALSFATDNEAITKEVGGNEAMQGPLVDGQLGFNTALKQPINNLTQAEKLLDKAGWKKNSEGKRTKGGKPLSVKLVSLNSGEYGTTTRMLQEQWSKAGITVDVSLVQQEDFQSNVITPHAYDVLVYELSMGRDSDVYPFWHSSQARAGRLNLSEYSSAVADDSLDSARTVTTPALREVKYRTFINQWVKDVPAVALYRPNLYYVQLAKTRSVAPGDMGDALERFSNIQYWTAEVTRVDATR